MGWSIFLSTALVLLVISSGFRKSVMYTIVFILTSVFGYYIYDIVVTKYHKSIILQSELKIYNLSLKSNAGSSYTLMGKIENNSGNILSKIDLLLNIERCKISQSASNIDYLKKYILNSYRSENKKQASLASFAANAISSDFKGKNKEEIIAIGQKADDEDRPVEAYRAVNMYRYLNGEIYLITEGDKTQNNIIKSCVSIDAEKSTIRVDVPPNSYREFISTVYLRNYKQFTLDTSWNFLIKEIVAK